MMGNGADQFVVVRNEDGDKEKRKSRRQCQRLKQNSSASELLELDAYSSNVHRLTKASVDSFNSSLTSRFSKKLDSEAMECRFAYSSDRGPRTIQKSCTPGNFFETSAESCTKDDFISLDQNDRCGPNKHFNPHWPMEAVLKALEKGNVFKALFRVNAHNRLEAYCRIDGVKTDVLINGIPSQNRAVDGDVVAIKVDPLPLWPRMRGSTVPVNNSGGIENCNAPPEGTDILVDNSKVENNLEVDDKHARSENCPTSANTSCHVAGVDVQNNVINELTRICAAVSSFPSKRPTGRVVAIIKRSPHRDAIVGYLNVKDWIDHGKVIKKGPNKKSLLPFSNPRHIQLLPTDPKFQKMRAPVEWMPDLIKRMLENGDSTVENELLAAQIVDWPEHSLVPQARVLHSFGRGGEIEPNIGAILFENAVHCSEFSHEALSCLPSVPWEVPSMETAGRRDLRELCTFTIDSSTATDLDDALSLEKLSNEVYRVGVHIADASYFIQPHSALDTEAQNRSQSVYLLHRKLPMLPPLLSENLGSFVPGVDRLAFSILFDINLSGAVIDRWIGRTVVQSCCKLSYDHVQSIIDGSFNAEKLKTLKDGAARLHDHIDWMNVTRSIQLLSEISKTLRENRFNHGALRLEGPKVSFLFDDDGNPYDTIMSYEQEGSYSLVEEFMLLANVSAAEVISRAFPGSALLRRHTEPDLRKLRELEAFCGKHNLELDTSDGQFQYSLERIREQLKDDSVLCDIIISYALKPMQVAKYFCSGVLKGAENNWGHYALAVPLYTHFSSPLRRYPDILVHRALAAALEAENMYRTSQIVKEGEEENIRCFTGLRFDKNAADPKDWCDALAAAAAKHGVPCTELLDAAADYCNERALASRHVKDACDRLYMWVLLNKREKLVSEARVLGLGPRFMSIYVQKLAIERRIYYDEVDGLTAEWLDATSTLVLSFPKNRPFGTRACPGKYRPLNNVAWVVDPSSQIPEDGCTIEPVVSPLTIRHLSTIPVAVCAIGGDDGPIDVRVKLYVASYFG